MSAPLPPSPPRTSGSPSPPTSTDSHAPMLGFTLRVAYQGVPEAAAGKEGKQTTECTKETPAKVFQGVSEFEEQLAHTCSVHGSRSGPHHSAKYDLTSLLPLTFEELEDEKSSGKWTTTYKLQGKVAGALMNVSFGYVMLWDNPFPPPNDKNDIELLSSKQNNATAVKSLVRGSIDDVRSWKDS